MSDKTSPVAAAPPAVREGTAGLTQGRPLAVIDVGSTSVRMTIAQVDAAGAFHTVESLQVPVNLGRDTFTKGRVDPATIEECVEALRGFQRVLTEYKLDLGNQVRAVATSAVREAANRDVLLDRVYIATGIAIETMDEAEENRFMFLSAQPYLGTSDLPDKPVTLIVEVGGGSTEMLVVRKGRVMSSHTYRHGSIRMLGDLGAAAIPDPEHLAVFETQIHRTVSTVRRELSFRGTPNLLALGGDLRFAAAQLMPRWRHRGLARLAVARLNQFTQSILKQSTDALVREYRLSYSDAETLGPALLTTVRLATALGLMHVHVTPISMRDGVLFEMADEGRWSRDFQEQIVSSALEIGRKYQFDQRHGEHVADLCALLFQGLVREHQLGPRYELILRVAALLHETGLFISQRSHHKHSFYLIRNSILFGLSPRDILLTALVARYHRRAMPQPVHEGYGTLDRESRVTVAKLAAILRVADCLDRSATQRVRTMEIALEPQRMILTVHNVTDLTLERAGMNQKADLFRSVYGREVVLRKGRAV